ncbi:MAG: hypothetical protein HFE62_03000 [Firmicutes bacterium]|nr:hypothetical protein [Bacillota bacterium]
MEMTSFVLGNGNIRIAANVLAWFLGFWFKHSKKAIFKTVGGARQALEFCFAKRFSSLRATALTVARAECNSRGLRKSHFLRIETKPTNHSKRTHVQILAAHGNFCAALCKAWELFWDKTKKPRAQKVSRDFF